MGEIFQGIYWTSFFPMFFCHLICFVRSNNCHFNDLKLNLKLKVRYYATFKVRKLESLFYKINRFLKKKLPLALGIADRANIICKYIIYIFFQFWAWLLMLVFCVISKVPILKWFLLHFTCIGMSSKSVSQIFKAFGELQLTHISLI